jgi:hypothetical protein
MSALAKVERGERCARPEVQEALAGLFARPIDELFMPYEPSAHGGARGVVAREQLLAASGACGSPTCVELECNVDAGRCHRSGCSAQANIARQTRPDVRWVIGRPTLYCGTTCARTARRERIAAIRSQGLLTAEDVGARLDRAARNIERLAAVLVVGRRLPDLGPHGGMWFFTEEEATQIGSHAATSKVSGLHGDVKRRREWGHNLHGVKTSRVKGSTRQRWQGAQGDKGAVDGFEKGGRKVAWGTERETSAMQRRILELDKQGLKSRQIAVEVFGNERFHLRVWRFLNR